MNSFKSALRTAGLSAMVFTLVACENTPTTETSVEKPALKEGVVFSEAFADAGLFTIEKSTEGGYNYSVSARIGSEAEKRMAASIEQPSLAEVYREIHAGKSETPAVVSEVSQWLKSRPSSGVEKVSPAQAPLALGKTAAESDFRNGYCKNFGEGLYYVWKPMSCIWKANSNYMGTGGVNSYFDANDRVWFWNATPHHATLELWNTAHTAKVSTWVPYQTPYTVSWFSWGGTYTNARATMKLPGTFGGELGISNSSRYYK